ncbi:cbb3-type cytochrome c oxidase subunit 3 [Ensifer sp. MJa1]|uniref:cbb3-type cytochrome c oxidase subunit 3 n=1 Tax=Ensifer sp. MJa1 TaxID=2919888 RepID=UPI00300B4164
MTVDHQTLVAIAKSWGMFYLIAMAVAATAYALWPSHRQRFDRAKHSILDKDDNPWS